MRLHWALIGLLGLGCVDTSLPEGASAAAVFPGPSDGPICTQADLSPSDPDTLVVHFIDVGQGDAIWLRLPTGDPLEPEDILVDTGDAPFAAADRTPDGGQIIADYMEANGLPGGDLIDWLVVTHGDRDHYAGTPTLLERYGVRNFASSGYITPGNSWPQVREQVRQEVALRGGIFGDPAIPKLVAASGDEVEAMGTGFATVELLWSTADPVGEGVGDGRNNSAVVLRVTVNGVTLLLPSDIGEEVEAKLVALHDQGQINLQAQVLKVPHHGSNSSNTEPFLTRIFAGVPTDARYAVIESGRKSFNGVHLPREEIVAAIRLLVGAGHLLSTEHDDEAKAEGEEANDDHVVLTVAPGGFLRLCYNRAGTTDSVTDPTNPASPLDQTP